MPVADRIVGVVEVALIRVVRGGQPVEVCHIVHQPETEQLVDIFLAKTVDIHGIAGREMPHCLFEPGRARHVHAAFRSLPLDSDCV